MGSSRCVKLNFGVLKNFVDLKKEAEVSVGSIQE
jgi:hypothetical protein